MEQSLQGFSSMTIGCSSSEVTFFLAVVTSIFYIDSDPEVSSSKDMTEALKKDAAEFLLRQYSDEKLAQSAVQTIIPAVEDLFEKIVNKLNRQIAISHPNIAERIQVPNIFEGLRSFRGHLPYFEKHLNLTLPEQISLPTDYDNDFGRHRQGRDKFFKQQSYQYVSIMKQLEQLLNQEDVYSAIFKNIQDGQVFFDRYQNFSVGKKYSTCKLFNDHPNAIQIILYFNEVVYLNRARLGIIRDHTRRV